MKLLSNTNEALLKPSGSNEIASKKNRQSLKNASFMSQLFGYGSWFASVSGNSWFVYQVLAVLLHLINQGRHSSNLSINVVFPEHSLPSKMISILCEIYCDVVDLKILNHKVFNQAICIVANCQSRLSLLNMV